MIYIIGFSDYFMRNAFYPSTEPTLCFIEVIKSFFWFIITPYRFINDIIFDLSPSYIKFVWNDLSKLKLSNPNTSVLKQMKGGIEK